MSIIKLDPNSKSVEDIIKSIVTANYKSIVILGQTESDELEISCSDTTSAKIAWIIMSLNKWYYNK